MTDAPRLSDGGGHDRDSPQGTALVAVTDLIGPARSVHWSIFALSMPTLVLLAVPLLPGLRDIHDLIPLHRLVWRTWNHKRSIDLGAP